MSIYLAWSLYKLIGVLAVIILTCGALLWAGSKQTRFTRYKPAIAVVAAMWAIMTLLAAFNIGDRQQHLTRSSFNATFPTKTPAYVPPPPDHIKAAKEALDKNVLELTNSIKERKQ